MSRVSILEQLYSNKNKKSALEFNYDVLVAPPIRSIFSQDDINKLYQVATSLRYNANIEKKYELIDEVMKSRGFRRAHCGTNRVVYESIYDTTFVAKVAIDKVGMTDSPAEFKNQEFFKPFCCKIFEVDPTGVLAFVERVNPITSLEEFLSVFDDVFTMMITKIIGKYVVDDLGTDKFMNYGLRYNSYTGHTFGPVIIDFPYAYELDGDKLICQKPMPNGIPCGGEIDYDIGFNNLVCTKCGKKYTALDLKKHTDNILIIHKGDNNMRVRVKKNGKVIFDSGLSSKTYITKEDYDNLQSFDNELPLDKPIIAKKRMIRKQTTEDYYNKYFVQPQINFFDQFKSEQKSVKVIKVSDILNRNKEEYNTEESKVLETSNTVKVSRIVDADTKTVVYEAQPEEIKPVYMETYKDFIRPKEPEESITVDDPIDETVTVLDSKENIFDDILPTEEDYEQYYEDCKLAEDEEKSIVNKEDENQEDTEKEEDEMKIKYSDKVKQDDYVSVLDYHGDDNNYNMKQRRKDKRNKSKKYRNKGFNKFDDDDINNF